ncbi:2-aminoethylphosphonate--pyruvate transaminase [Cupriavidus gilardii]|uniref:2-aminoethylphosphonate--pyruvate transaminase n=1 Tax=Cupriavidus gilardii TaxID=82541 RepID=UPI0021C072CC|nr:2-aminoethylphosphonate--pyruvate transaminase [Cupriavidus gilardii]MCT9124367.1 2-aminoethylphosphonate--pyruvate transaminase [Cupriavidus gilardii]
MIRGNDPILLTPGPLTTSLATKQAMLRDWGSWDAAFNAITGSLCEDLVRIVHGEGTHVCVPMQGSGTFSVEAAMANVVPRDGKVLVPQNGAYCQRILKICKAIGRAAVELAIPEDQPASAAAIEAALAADPSITHVAQVHCETGAGVLNPLPEIAQLCARLGKGLIVDAMSSFGAIEIDARTMPFDALVAATGKCIEGVPGMGFVLVRKDVLEASEGNSHSLALDLYDQYAYMQKTTQWRFTPPTHVVAAFRAALDQYLAEGGQAARGARYRRNCAALIDGMRELGFRPFLRPEVQAPIIVTFHAPDDPRYDFKTFYAKVRERGYILYPGKLTQVETFRVGCIGAIDDNEMRNVVSAIGLTLQEMGIDMAAQLARAA